MTTTVTGTKEVGSGGYTLADFTSKIGGTLVKIGSVAAGNITLTDGVIDGADRVVDMVANGGSLDGLTIQRVKATGLRRGLARFRSAQNILIEDFIAEGRTPPGDYYPTGVATSDLPTKNLTIRRGVFRGFVGKPGSSYTNGDGVAQEELSTNTLLEDVVSEDNADGGFDIKGQVVGRRLHGSRNHRNLRLWGSFDITDFTSEDPRNAHIWLGGGGRLKGGTITRPTFIGGSSKPHIKLDSKSGPATLTIIDPVLPAGETLRIQKEGGSQVKVVIEYTTDDKKGVVATRPAPPNLSGQPTSDPEPPVVTPPVVGTPTTVTASATVVDATSIRLDWDVTAGTDGATGLVVSRDGDSTDRTTPGYSELRPLSDGGITLRALIPGQLYKFTVEVQPGGATAVTGKVLPGGEPVEPVDPPVEPDPTPDPDVQARLDKALALLARIAAVSATAHGGSTDKTAQIAALHILAVTPV